MDYMVTIMLLFTLGHGNYFVAIASPICDDKTILHNKLIVYCRCNSVNEIHINVSSLSANNPSAKVNLSS